MQSRARSIGLRRREPLTFRGRALNFRGTGAEFIVEWMLAVTDVRVGVVYRSVLNA